MTFYKRSEWTASRPGCSTKLTGVKGVAIHYPGGNIPDQVADGRVAATAAYLDGVRSSQMSSTKYDYCDIEYSLAVDRRGGIWKLRGLNVRPGSNGTSAANEAYPSIFVIVGLTKNERPTRAQIRGIRRAVKKVRGKYPGANEIRPHGDFVATACPGFPLKKLINSGALEPGAFKKLRGRIRNTQHRINKLQVRLSNLKVRLRRKLGG